MTSNVKIGLAEVMITPPQLGGTMAGYAARKGVSQDLHDDLHARAIVIEGADTAVAMLTASVIGISQSVLDGTRKRVNECTGLPESHIMMAATHTHSGPTPTEEYNAFLEEKCVECLLTAWERRREARLGVGSVCVENVARNRRRLGYGGLPVDPEIGVIKAEDLGGKILGVLFNYTCHPTVMGPRNLSISEDWPYYAIRTIRDQIGPEAVVGFFNGAEGDINPGYSSGLSAVGALIPMRNWAFTKKFGTPVGWAVLGALSEIETKTSFPIRSLSRRVDLPFRTTFPLTMEEMEKQVRQAEETLADAEAREGISGMVLDRAQVDVFFARLVRNSARWFYSDDRESHGTVELQTIQIDDTAFTSFPGEVFVEIGLEVKRRSPFEKTFIIGLGNAGRTGGYLPTREAFEEGDYEVFGSRYREDAGEVLVEATVEQIEELRG